MTSANKTRFLVVGAGAAGLMTAYELASAGARVTVIEARDRCGGRIYPLATEKFGYPAEGGAEFVHGDAPVTRALVRDLGLAFLPRAGSRWNMRGGQMAPREPSSPFEADFHRALKEANTDLPIAEFLERHFSDPRYEPLRRNVTRMVQGYDLADPRRMSTFAIRDEWIQTGERKDSRIEGGYGRLIEHLVRRCRDHGVDIRLGVALQAIEETGRGIIARCDQEAAFEADAAILSLPLPILAEITLPPSQRRRQEAIGDIGYGDVVKILLRFRRMWWIDHDGRDFADLSFFQTDAQVPTWWTQYPAPHPVLTGWYPLNGEHPSSLSEDECIEVALASLAETFGVPVDTLRRELVAAQAINWKHDPFARGAYSYATPRTHDAQILLNQPDGSAIYFCGEALYTGPDIGTVEAALASGQQTAKTILLRQKPSA
jgi:monoamine oxidase